MARSFLSSVLAGFAVAISVVALAQPAAEAGTARPGIVPDGSRAAAPGTVPGVALQVPGFDALSAGGGINHGVFTSLSCASSGNCSGGGEYPVDGSGHMQAYLVSEVKGRWRNAEKVPGLAALNTDSYAQLTSVSCASAGNCAAGGSYNGPDGTEAFVVNQAKGAWARAIEVPGTAALNPGGDAELASLACPSAGNCTGGGFYVGDSANTEAFVVSERNGTWGTAVEVPGTAALNAGGDAAVTSVACPSIGNCTAGGYYVNGSGAFGAPDDHAFVVSERNGTWGNAVEVPGLAALNTGKYAQLTSVACGSAGNCAAGGLYTGSGGSLQAFIVSEKSGAWGRAVELPGTAGLNTGKYAQLISVACASAGNCAAGGYYTGSGGSVHAFIVSEKSGAWGRAVEVPGLAALNTGKYAQLTSVACASAGNCAAGGFYAGSGRGLQAFIVTERNGTWGKATEVADTAALNAGRNAGISAVSCARAGTCSAGGYYSDSSGDSRAFVVGPKDWAGSSFCSNPPHWTARYTRETWNGVAACGTADTGSDPNHQGRIFYGAVTFNTVGFQCEELAARYFYYVTGQDPPLPKEAPTGAGFAYDLNRYDKISVYPSGKDKGTNKFQRSIKEGNIISMWPTGDPTALKYSERCPIPGDSIFRW